MPRSLGRAASVFSRSVCTAKRGARGTSGTGSISQVQDTGGSVALGFAPSALSAEPDAVALRRLRRRYQNTTGIPGARARRRAIADSAVRVVLAAGLLLFFGLTIAMVIPMTRTSGIGGLVGVGFVGLVGVGGLVFVLRPIWTRWRGLRPWRRWFRLESFAADNGL